MSPIAFSGIAFPTPTASLYYRICNSSEGLLIQTYRRIAEEYGCGSCDDTNTRRPIFEKIPKQQDSNDDLLATIAFASEHDAQSEMLDFESLKRALQTWPWNPVSAPAYRQSQYTLAVARGTAAGICNAVTAWTSEDLENLLGRHEINCLILNFVPSLEDIAKVCSAPQIIGIAASLLTDGEVEQLCQCRKMEYLGLQRCRVTNSISSSVNNLMHLRHLDVSKTNLSDRFFQECDVIGRVGVLSMSESLVTNECCDWSERRNSTQFLDCSRTHLSDMFFLAHPECWSQIVGLKVSQTRISDLTVAFLAEIKSLMQLDLDFCDISWKSLSKFRGNANLTRLSLRGVNIASEQFCRLRASMPQCLVTM